MYYIYYAISNFIYLFIPKKDFHYYNNHYQLVRFAVKKSKENPVLRIPYKF